MTALEVYLCGSGRGFDTSSGNAFADAWEVAPGFDSVPPMRPTFATLSEACEWIAANFAGQNPCQTQ